MGTYGYAAPEYVMTGEPNDSRLLLYLMFKMFVALYALYRMLAFPPSRERK